MGKEEKTPNSIYLVDDLLEDIFLQLPLKSILKSKTVSKHWRSILESKKFIERRMSIQKSRKIIAAYNCDCGEQLRLLPVSRFKGDEELVYLHCKVAETSMTCDGLVCIPENYWINVLNPWTRQLRRYRYGIEAWSASFSQENLALGFGRDIVTWSYKVVKMCYVNDHVLECSVLDVETGDWRMLSPPRYKVDSRIKSVCVNGSIYWLQNFKIGYKILALDLHKEEFRNVSVPDTSVTQETTQIVNFEDRLVIANTYTNPEWKLEIWSMDTKEETWSKTYSISLAGKGVLPEIWTRWFTPIVASKQGNLVFNDNHKRLFKYYPKTDEIRCLSSNTCVISPFFENLAPLPLRSTLPFPHPRRTSKCRLLSERNEFGIIDVLLTALVVVSYIWLPLF